MNRETPTAVTELVRAKESGDVRVRIILGDEEHIQRMAVVLHSFPPNLCSVSLVGRDVPNADGTGWEIPKMTPILMAIEDLPAIVHVQFENSSVHGWTLKATDLTAFLHHTRLRLETLDFTAVRVEGTRSELKAMDRAIAGLVCLRGCCLQNNFLLWIHDDKEIYPLDDMLQAIAKLPLLQEVYIDLDHWNDEAHKRQLLSSSKTLRAILSSSSIQDFFLGKLDPTHPAIQDIARALAAPPNTSHIRFLSLQFKPQPLTKASNTAVHNTTTTTAHRAKTPTPPIATSLECLAKALRVNTSLQELRLSFGNDNKCPNLDAFLVQAANELSANAHTHLSKLEVVSPCNYGVAVEEAFVSLLRTNYTLTELEFYSNLGDKYVSLDGSHRTEMHLYLSLNAEGRQKLLQTYERSAWVTALANNSHSLDALFYYLTINPWLMSDSDDTDWLPKKKRRPLLLQGHLEAPARKMRRLEEQIRCLQRENDALKQQQQKAEDPCSLACVIM